MIWLRYITIFTYFDQTKEKEKKKKKIRYKFLSAIYLVSQFPN